MRLDPYEALAPSSDAMESCKQRSKQGAVQLCSILDELGNVRVIHTVTLHTMLGLALKNIYCIVCLSKHDGCGTLGFFALPYGFVNSYMVADSHAKDARNLDKV